ncbi:hypothetical protein M0R36_10915 [bacterium]|jgi:hypothetical protein|nr:hypothetical protein [bacterium]
MKRLQMERNETKVIDVSVSTLVVEFEREKTDEGGGVLSVMVKFGHGPDAMRRRILPGQTGFELFKSVKWGKLLTDYMAQEFPDAAISDVATKKTAVKE